MIFQNININDINTASNQEFMKICSEHPECKDCPLKDEDVQLQSGITRCLIGRQKENSNG